MDDSTDAAPERERWLLYRIDDNGNEVAMRRFATRDDAEAAMREYEARGHKQAYLVREEQREA
ncbi:hypothetical protein E5198_08845 [Pseudomonas sp. A-1]|uniref:hypothetical protein n=1 Tax=Pseudomonas sp. A-1 TaxID=1821274 RepID=UPI0010A61D85|nr:hypothetical protein [Pseudomonas sp. A-1]THG82843.1 hypothetical protein E5198_08845 [Pseudomonas sp. A-1]